MPATRFKLRLGSPACLLADLTESVWSSWACRWWGRRGSRYYRGQLSGHPRLQERWASLAMEWGAGWKN